MLEYHHTEYCRIWFDFRLHMNYTIEPREEKHFPLNYFFYIVIRSEVQCKLLGQLNSLKHFQLIPQVH